MSPTLDQALALDAADPLYDFRDRFHIPQHHGEDQAYFCGNSLGLQPRAVRAALVQELDDWAALGVEAHFRGKHPWMPYHNEVREGLAMLVGAQASEVVAMNSLTANLHFLMVSFYRPTRERPAILIEAGAFPSDRYGVESQIRFHGFDPATDLIELEADEPGGTISMAAIERVLAEHGHRIALVLWPGVQYRTGQAFDLKEIVRLGHAQGCVVGFDLAHGAGNLRLALHDSGVDFAAWCHYKYCNAGPGAVAGAFVHERHARTERPRFAGWWGHDQATRFRMGPQFQPTPGADGWQLSNPPILALAPLRVSLELFAEAGMDRLRAKSEKLTAHLEALIAARCADVLDVVTPSNPARRGCQLSLRVAGGRARGRELFEYLETRGIVGDWREPDVIRISPVPLYNRYADLHRFVDAVERWRDGG
ncbi:kynureninase [Arenimonas terrae]|uniref:Kynureninase n=1 Tax=Arenimonas terrae TaxID=2546226 RepID=A0A5C4RU78_9GAMM|nr:kynureninase [Arenimonas terrae]TNJ34489.1 kynureninase [Arenimonas terrae]